MGTRVQIVAWQTLPDSIQSVFIQKTLGRWADILSKDRKRAFSTQIVPIRNDDTVIRVIFLTI